MPNPLVYLQIASGGLSSLHSAPSAVRLRSINGSHPKECASRRLAATVLKQLLAPTPQKILFRIIATK
jgi:hypothetical protein